MACEVLKYTGPRSFTPNALNRVHFGTEDSSMGGGQESKWTVIMLTPQLGIGKYVIID